METQAKPSFSMDKVAKRAGSQQPGSGASTDGSVPTEHPGTHGIPNTAGEVAKKKRQFEICVQKKQSGEKKIPKVGQLCTKPEPPPPVVHAKEPNIF